MKKSNLIFLLFTGIALVVIWITSFNGKQQDERFAVLSQKYNEATQILSSQQGNKNVNIDQAVSILSDLKKEQPNSVAITCNLGLAYAIKKDYKSAANVYKRAIELKPFLTAEPIFMLQFGEILFFNNQKEEARMVLEKASKLTGPEVDKAYNDRIGILLKATSGLHSGGQ